MVPSLEARIMQSSEEEVVLIADLVSMLHYRSRLAVDVV